MNWQLLAGAWLIGGALALLTPAAWADDPAPPSPPTPASPPAGEAASGATAEASGATAEERAAVQDALRPVAQAIQQAKAGRAAVELTTRSMIDGRVVASEQAVVQIASKTPHFYRIQLKGEQQQLQMVSDGEQVSVLLGGNGYYQVQAPETLQQAVTELPVPLGPYPEPLLALTLAGVDLADSLLSDMQRLEVVNRDPDDGVEAVQLRGVQSDGVSWVLWLATEQAKPRPLRMKIDLTAVVVSDDEEFDLPQNFALELDFKFTLWRMDGELQQSTFVFEPPADAQRFESLEDYAQAMAQQERHPLLGQPAPEFSSELLDGTAWQLSKQRGKVVVLDFWATWCGPCIEAMPVIDEVAKAFADRDVVFYGVNIGESPEQIKPFLERLKIDAPVLLDRDMSVAGAYAAEAIPQTVLIGKDGRVEAVQVGFAGLEALKQELTEQLEVLVSGGQLVAAEAD